MVRKIKVISYVSNGFENSVNKFLEEYPEAELIKINTAVLGEDYGNDLEHTAFFWYEEK